MAIDEKQRREFTRSLRRYDLVAVVIACMAAIWSLSLGGRFHSAERTQARLAQQVEGLRQEVSAVRQELAQTRQAFHVAQGSGGPASTAGAGLQVTDAQGAAVPLSPPDSQARLAVLEARHTRLVERLNTLVRDIKSSNVDLGITDKGQ